MARRRKGPKQQTLESTLGMYFAILSCLSWPLLQLSHMFILFAVDGVGVAIDLGMSCCFSAFTPLFVAHLTFQPEPFHRYLSPYPHIHLAQINIL